MRVTVRELERLLTEPGRYKDIQVHGHVIVELGAKDDLPKLLSLGKVNYALWERDPRAKSIEHLWIESAHGENEFKIRPHDRFLRRCIKTVLILLVCRLTIDDKLYQLVLAEGEHLMPSGHRFTRDLAGSSLAEKRRFGESILVTVIRALAEELGIYDLSNEEIALVKDFALSNIIHHETTTPDKPSKSYPGLHTNNERTMVRAELLSHRHRPMYTEHKDDGGQIDFYWATKTLIL